MSSKLSFEEASALVMQHVKERHWDMNPSRGLAISLSLEANELLEHFQWHDEPVGNRDELAGELADVLIYAIQFAARNDIDIPSAIQAKLEKQAKKYPAELFETGSEQERSERWLEAKRSYKKETTL